MIFWPKKLILFFKNNFTSINHCKFIHPKSHLKPFLSYLPCIVRRKYFSIIFQVKKYALHLIKYGIYFEVLLKIKSNIHLFSKNSKDSKYVLFYLTFWLSSFWQFCDFSFKKLQSMSRTMEPLLKGKAQYERPPH